MLEIGRMLATASLRRLNFDYVPARMVQTAIAATTPLLCRPLHLTHVVEFPKCGGSWVRDWLDRPRICLVHFEDMLSDPEAQLVRILNFTERPVNREHVRRVVAENSFEELTRRRDGKTRESGQGDNSKFLRRGVAGDWRNHFNARSCELIWKHAGSALERLGYESDSTWIAGELPAAGASGSTP